MLGSDSATSFSAESRGRDRDAFFTDGPAGRQLVIPCGNGRVVALSIDGIQGR